MFRRYQALTELTAKEASAALSDNVSPRRWFNYPDTPFAGEVSGIRFRITRVVRGRDSFNPVLYGRITSAPAGSRVRITMTLHPVAWIFLVAWSGVIGWLIVGREEREF